VLPRPPQELLTRGPRRFVLRTHAVEHPPAVEHGP
jgi:hypothetical protein